MLNTLIRRPVAIILITWAVFLLGILAYWRLPVAPLPKVEFPTIAITANQSGASAEVMAATVATPLERFLGGISGVTEMTSLSSQGRSRIVLQFDLDRDIDEAATDVYAAINAAHSDLPSGLTTWPTVRKVNPADSPIMVLALKSDVLPRSELYDFASTVLVSYLAQVSGVGQVDLGGGALPAVRIAVDPIKLRAAGLSIEDIHKTILTEHRLQALGFLNSKEGVGFITANDQLVQASDFANAKLSTAVSLSDVATVSNSVQDKRNYGAASDGADNTQPAVLLVLYKQADANVIETVERVKSLLPKLQTLTPQQAQLQVVVDRTLTIRASLVEVQRSLLIAVLLLVLVVYIFLGQSRTAWVTAIVVPASLSATLALMYLGQLSLDNISLMALTVSTGLLVDDVIVVIENVHRYQRHGVGIYQACIKAVGDIKFTLFAIGMAVAAVFTPVLWMGGMIGRLFSEFAVVIIISVGVSTLFSLTIAPALLVFFSTRQNKDQPRLSKPSFFKKIANVWNVMNRRWQKRLLNMYATVLRFVLRCRWIVLLVWVGVLIATFVLYQRIPKSFFPQQDTGRIFVTVQAEQSASFSLMQEHLEQLMQIFTVDPAVAYVAGFTGSSQRNTGTVFLTLKPRYQRNESIDESISRLRKKTISIPGLKLFFSAVQDIRVGGRSSFAQYQYTLKSDSISVLRQWEPRVREALKSLSQLQEIDSDDDRNGLQLFLEFDRYAMAVHGIDMQTIANSLNSGFSQHVVHVIYNPDNQYRVVLEWDQSVTEPTEAQLGLEQVFFKTHSGHLVNLQSIASIQLSYTPLAVAHQSGFAAATISFNLAPNISLSEAKTVIAQAIAQLGLPDQIHGGFEGSAKMFVDSLKNQPILIIMALISIYLILGILYESLLQPITILSTLPTAGLGVLLALIIDGKEFTVIALIGVFLLMGIVMKNAILIVDVALQVQRVSSFNAACAVYRACRIRFRPILMTSLAALLAALPLYLSQSEGAELRQPLGLAMIGGVLLSQVLTVFTVPVIFVFLDRCKYFLLKSFQKIAVVLIAWLVGACTVSPILPTTHETTQSVEPQAQFNTMPWLAINTDYLPKYSNIDALWWQKIFSNPSENILLFEVMSRIQTHNIQLQISHAQWEEAQANLQARRSALWPTLNATSAVQRSANSLTNPRGTSLSAGFSVPNWEMDIWGRLRQQTTAAEFLGQSAFLSDQLVKQTVQAKALEQYFSWCAAGQVLQIQQDNLQIQEALLQLSKARFAAGGISKSELNQLQINTAQFHQQVFDARSQLQKNAHALSTAVGRSLEPIFFEKLQYIKSCFLSEPYKPSKNISAQIILNRPDIQGAIYQLHAAQANQKAAFAAFFPNINLSANFGYRARSWGDLIHTPNEVWTLGPNLVFAIFDGGARRAAKAQADAQSRLAQANYRQTVLLAIQEMEDSLSTAYTIDQQHIQLKERIQIAEQSLRLAKIQNEAGFVGLDAVFQAGLQLNNLKKELIYLQFQKITSVILAYRASGFGLQFFSESTH